MRPASAHRVNAPARCVGASAPARCVNTPARCANASGLCALGRRPWPLRAARTSQALRQRGLPHQRGRALHLVHLRLGVALY